MIKKALIINYKNKKNNKKNVFFKAYGPNMSNEFEPAASLINFLIRITDRVHAEPENSGA